MNSSSIKCVPGYKVGEWPGQVKNLYLDPVWNVTRLRENVNDSDED